MTIRGLGVRPVLLGGMLVLSLAACGGLVGGQSSPTGASSAASSAGGSVSAVDPCKLLSPQELQQLEVPPNGDEANRSGETGCQWTGQKLFVSLTKANNSLDYFTQHADQYTDLTQDKVNDRAGVHFQISQSNTECSQAVAVGTGYVRVGLGYFDHSPDPCGKALQIAQMVEPRLPK
jgi:hypothetical protein